jgi:hypothetical protein
MTRVNVVRRGGLAGIPLRGSVDLADLPAEAGRAATAALNAAPAAAEPPHPDGFQYELAADGRTVTLNESQIPEALRPLIDAALAHGTLG